MSTIITDPTKAHERFFEETEKKLENHKLWAICYILINRPHHIGERRFPSEKAASQAIQRDINERVTDYRNDVDGTEFWVGEIVCRYPVPVSV